MKLNLSVGDIVEYHPSIKMEYPEGPGFFIPRQMDRPLKGIRLRILKFDGGNHIYCTLIKSLRINNYEVTRGYFHPDCLKKISNIPVKPWNKPYV